jgi:thiamine-phosphate pyrophosphorylase
MPPNRPIAGATESIMASRGNRTEPRRPAARLYLATPPVADPAGPAAALAAALGAADVAAVLLRLAAADDGTLVERVKSLAPLVQARGVALILESRGDIVLRSGADGAHRTGIDELRTALAALKPERIVGCGGLATRHDAMLAAEAGADYVMFGEPAAERPRPSFGALIERIAWWAELFEVPCVAFAASAEEVAPLAAAGADFVAVGDWVFADAPGPADAIAEAARRIALTELV